MKTIYYFNILITFIVILFLADIYSPFEIKNMILRYFIYACFVLSPFVIIFNLILISNLKIKLLSLIIPVFIFVFSLSIGYMPILFNSSNWNTQTILYENKNNNNLTIEFQMQDIGALGYNRRTVKVEYLTNLFILVNPINIDTVSTPDWILLNRNINELKLKGG